MPKIEKGKEIDDSRAERANQISRRLQDKDVGTNRDYTRIGCLEGT